MQKERFRPYTFQEMSHAERRQKLERGRATLFRDRLTYLRNGGVYMGEILIDPDVLSDHIDFQAGIMKVMGLNGGITEVYTEEEKAALFNPIIEGMNNLAASQGLSLPKDPLSRLFILHSQIVGEIAFQEEGKPSAALGGAEIALTLPDHSCLVNYDMLPMVLLRHNIPSDLLIQTVGTHELWHSMSYSEIWQPLDLPYSHYTSKQLEKRHGFCIKGPLTNTANPNQHQSQLKLFYALHILDEAFTDFLTQKTIQESLKPSYAYPQSITGVSP